MKLNNRGAYQIGLIPFILVVTLLFKAIEAHDTKRKAEYAKEHPVLKIEPIDKYSGQTLYRH